MEAFVITGELAVEFKAFLAERMRVKEIKKASELPGFPIISAVAIKNLISMKYLAGSRTIEMRCNAKGVVKPRMIAMYLMRRLTDLSLPAIGLHFGGKHHTTVQYAIEKIEEEMKMDKKFAEEVAELARELTA